MRNHGTGNVWQWAAPAVAVAAVALLVTGCGQSSVLTERKPLSDGTAVERATPLEAAGRLDGDDLRVVAAGRAVHAYGGAWRPDRNAAPWLFGSPPPGYPNFYGDETLTYNPPVQRTERAYLDVVVTKFPAPGERVPLNVDNTEAVIGTLADDCVQMGVPLVVTRGEARWEKGRPVLEFTAVPRSVLAPAARPADGGAAAATTPTPESLSAQPLVLCAPAREVTARLRVELSAEKYDKIQRDEPHAATLSPAALGG
jgi:hypothetical protein